MGTKANPGHYDCYAKAEPDEPMFVLLGRDKHAASLVILWALLRELDGEDQEVVKEANQCSADMVAYAVEKGRPVVGTGAVALTAMLNVINVANWLLKKLEVPLPNEPTSIGFFRAVMARTDFAPPDSKDGP